MLKTQAYDRFGRVLQAGDLVILLEKGPIVWRVQEVRPVLSPQAPPGVVEISLVAIFATGAPGGTPIGDLIKVRDAGEMQPAVEES